MGVVSIIDKIQENRLRRLGAVLKKKELKHLKKLRTCILNATEEQEDRRIDSLKLYRRI